MQPKAQFYIFATGPLKNHDILYPQTLAFSINIGLRSCYFKKYLNCIFCPNHCLNTTFIIEYYLLELLQELKYLLCLL
jgi:hypothetical protein